MEDQHNDLAELQNRLVALEEKVKQTHSHANRALAVAATAFVFAFSLFLLQR